VSGRVCANGSWYIVSTLEESRRWEQCPGHRFNSYASWSWSAVTEVVTMRFDILDRMVEVVADSTGLAITEVEDGFVDAGTGYPDVARSAETLVSDLRRRVSEIYLGLE